MCLGPEILPPEEGNIILIVPEVAMQESMKEAISNISQL